MCDLSVLQLIGPLVESIIEKTLCLFLLIKLVCDLSILQLIAPLVEAIIERLVCVLYWLKLSRLVCLLSPSD